MKSYTYSLLVLLAITSACSKKEAKMPEDLRKLTAYVDSLKATQTTLSRQIAAAEEKLALLSPDAKAQGKEVGVTALTPGKFDYFVQTQGAVESIDNIMVSAKSMGVITQVFATEGETVTKGQMLGQIDNTLIVRGIDELKGQLDLANTVYERQKNLWDQKIGTEVQFLQAKNNKESLERRLASLNEQNDMTRIKAPISGTVDEVSLRVGQNIAPGMPCVRIVSFQNLKVKAPVSEAYVSNVKKGNKVVVYLPDLKKEIATTVSFVSRNINQLSRTFNMEVKLPSDPDLRPNMSVVVKVIYDSYSDALVVPVNVIQTVNGEKVLYVAEKDANKTVARKRVLKVGGIFDNKAQILSGLAVGEQVITTGFQSLNDGELVKI
ncbi:MAG: efflux RND transporter periplasmic adaptor subunit [Cyclobacteriaceae bacterium]|nr:efflux RND transporter periplasmic adaptor subunit [Cyclobacteriaceae bacterium]